MFELWLNSIMAVPRARAAESSMRQMAQAAQDDNSQDTRLVLSWVRHAAPWFGCRRERMPGSSAARRPNRAPFPKRSGDC
jgi:hypothetical protein